MDDEARDNLKESFAADMATAQQRAGKLPTPAENERLAVPLFEALEQKQAERAARFDPFKVDERGEGEAHQRALHEEAARRGRPEAPERMSTHRLPDQEPVAPRASAADLERARRMTRRLDLLMTKRERGPLGAPSWAERVQAVCLGRMVIGVDKRRVTLELLELLAASEAVFGPWDVPEGEGRPLIFV